MANCDNFIMMISSLEDCELSAEQEAELRAHMETCADCRRIYDAFIGISEAMSGDLTEPPETLSKGIMYKINSQANGKSPRFFAFGRFTAIAACLVLVLFGASRFGLFDDFFRSGSSIDAASEETTLSDSYSPECESVQDKSIENDSDSYASDDNVEYGSNDGNGSDEGGGAMFIAPTAGSPSGNGNKMYACESTVITDILSELFASDEIKVFEGAYGRAESTSLLTVSDAETQLGLLDILGYSDEVFTTPDLADTPDYTLLFPDDTTLTLWYADSSIYCMLDDCGTVYLANGTVEEFEKNIGQ